MKVKSSTSLISGTPDESLLAKQGRRSSTPTTERKITIKTQEDMTTRREKAKAQKPQFNKQLEAVNAEEPKVKVNSKSRKEKLSNYMIDVSKYVLTGVVITSLFNDVTDKTMLYLTGIFIVLLSLTIGLVLTEKKKGN